MEGSNYIYIYIYYGEIKCDMHPLVAAYCMMVNLNGNDRSCLLMLLASAILKKVFKVPPKQSAARDSGTTGERVF